MCIEYLHMIDIDNKGPFAVCEVINLLKSHVHFTDQPNYICSPSDPLTFF